MSLPVILSGSPRWGSPFHLRGRLFYSWWATFRQCGCRQLTDLGSVSLKNRTLHLLICHFIWMLFSGLRGTSFPSFDVNEDSEVFFACWMHRHPFQYLKVFKTELGSGLWAKVPGKHTPVWLVKDIADTFHIRLRHDFVVRINMCDVFTFVVHVLVVRLGCVTKLKLNKVGPVIYLLFSNLSYLSFRPRFYKFAFRLWNWLLFSFFRNRLLWWDWE